jgi:hypothetical protein
VADALSVIFRELAAHDHFINCDLDQSFALTVSQYGCPSGLAEKCTRLMNEAERSPDLDSPQRHAKSRPAPQERQHSAAHIEHRIIAGRDSSDRGTSAGLDLSHSRPVGAVRRVSQ